MKSNSGFAVSLIAIAIAFTASARAGEFPIDISALVNEPWTFSGPNGCTILNPTTWPTGPQNYGGVPFAIPTEPNNYWAGCAAANFGPGTVRVTIPVNLSGVTSVFSLLNTVWSQPGPQAYLFMTFNGSNGATFTQPLVGGVNVRDQNNDGGQNTINNTSTINIWNNGALGQRLDRQEYVLPAAFATQTLTSVTLTDTGDEYFSRAVFAGLTVSTCRAIVTEFLTISSSPIIYHQETKLYTQDVTLSNDGTTAVIGPVYLILEDLPAEVSLVNKSTPTACYAPIGSPYVIALPKGSSLAPDTSAIVHLAFTDPSGAAISYTPLTVNGHGGTP
jgi:hypothetical protein